MVAEKAAALENVSDGSRVVGLDELMADKTDEQMGRLEVATTVVLMDLP